MPSFDIVSEVNMQEVDNAINQVSKELQSRYDFKGSQFEVLWDKKTLSFKAEDEYKMGAIKDIIQTKISKRGVDILSFHFDKIEPIGGRMLKQEVKIAQGIDKEIAKKIVKALKDSKLKVQAAIQDDTIRVSSKSIDELQSSMALLRQSNFEIPLQFNNMRS